MSAPAFSSSFREDKSPLMPIDMNVRTLRFHEPAELHPVNPGHVDVCHDNIVSALLEKPDGLEPIACFIDPMAEKGNY